MLDRYNVDTKGKHTVVIGRSHIVGRPMSILMGRKGFPGNSTVTLTHSHTKNITQITSQADIIISALGVPNFLKAEMVKDDAVIIDVGITRVPDDTKERGYRITGDVDFENVSKKASHITPVPGGVGPMTIAMLLKNTLLARERHRKSNKNLLLIFKPEINRFRFFYANTISCSVWKFRASSANSCGCNFVLVFILSNQNTIRSSKV